MTGKRQVIGALYRQLDAPEWAAPNLDGLADVLRDLNWLPAGPVLIELPDLGGLRAPDREMLHLVLARAVTESVDSPRPIRVSGHRP